MFHFSWDIKNKTWEITEALRPLVVNVDYRRGGKSLFKAVHFAGYIGILTAIRPVRILIKLNGKVFAL
jgi:acid ceramidase